MFAFLVKAFLLFVLGIVFLSVVFALLVALFASVFASEAPLVASVEGLSIGLKIWAVVIVLCILGIPLYVLYRMVFCKNKIQSGALLTLLLIWLAACIAAVPLAKHCAKELDIDNAAGWQFQSYNTAGVPNWLLKISNYKVEGHHTETFTEPDGTVVTVRHHTIRTNHGTEERIDTIRTPAGDIPQLDEGDDFTDDGTSDDE